MKLFACRMLHLMFQHPNETIIYISSFHVMSCHVSLSLSLSLSPSLNITYIFNVYLFIYSFIYLSDYLRIYLYPSSKSWSKDVLSNHPHRPCPFRSCKRSGNHWKQVTSSPLSQRSLKELPTKYDIHELIDKNTASVHLGLWNLASTALCLVAECCSVPFQNPSYVYTTIPTHIPVIYI